LQLLDDDVCVGLGDATATVAVGEGLAVGVGFGVAVGFGVGVEECVGRGVGVGVVVVLGATGPRADADGLTVGSAGVDTDSGFTVEVPPLFEIAPATATPAIATPATASTVSATPRSPARAMKPRRRCGRRAGCRRPPLTSCRRRDIAHPPTICDFSRRVRRRSTSPPANDKDLPERVRSCRRSCR
jgi:hypothetical protein